jgi:putative (di)nucleoside polyphosphate hydrolase
MDLCQEKSLELYRPNVGIVLARGDGRVWLGRRAGTSGAYNWQFPQGGVDEGESLEAAAQRELHEETGATSVTLIGRTRDWISYEFPRTYRRSRPAQDWIGQKRIGFLFRFDGQDNEFDIAAQDTPEFDEWRWAEPEEALSQVVPFKTATYTAMLEVLGPLIKGLKTSEPPPT